MSFLISLKHSEPQAIFEMVSILRNHFCAYKIHKMGRVFFLQFYNFDSILREKIFDPTIFNLY